MGDSFLVDGGTLKCTFGDKESTFKVPTCHNVVLCDKSQGSILDFAPNVNILSFGMCSSLANPTVAAATAANKGVLKKMPCVPATTMPWIGGKPDVIVDVAPALMKSSTNMCMWCGVISVTKDGQEDGVNGKKGEKYNDFYVFEDEETGEPLKGVRYVIELENGERFEGITGDDGKTIKLHGNGPEKITIYTYE